MSSERSATPDPVPRIVGDTSALANAIGTDGSGAV